MITPDQARARMTSPRDRAARTIAEQIEEFIDAGNPDAVIMKPIDGTRKEVLALLAELITYRDAGWCVEFQGGCAAISLPEVVS